MFNPPSQLNLFRNTAVPGASVSPNGSSYVSNTQEPSIDTNGKNIFATGNWYTTRSFNNGATWQYLDPFATGTNFCCDQVAIYDASRNLQFWLLQYTDKKLKLFVSPGNDLTAWCSYTFTAASVGQPATSEPDYNDMALSNDFLYVSTNIFSQAGPWSASAMMRLPIDAMAGCTAVPISYYTNSVWFVFKPVQGATTTMYWASTTGNPPYVLGQDVRVFWWPETTTVVSFVDRVVAAFTYMDRSSGQNCGSQNFVVTSWCNYSDSRALGGYLAKGILGFSFNAKQTAGRPFPYTRLVRFSESSRNYIDSIDYWNSNYAVQFMTWAPNDRGDLGSVFAYGGGTNATPNYFPATGYRVMDDFGTTTGFFSSASNACTSSGIPRWGDYLTARAYNPSNLVWVGVSMRNMNGGPCNPPSGYSEVRNFVVGRERDAKSYLRWMNT